MIIDCSTNWIEYAKETEANVIKDDVIKIVGESKGLDFSEYLL